MKKKTTQRFPDGTWVDLTANPVKSTQVPGGSRRQEQSAVGERLEGGSRHEQMAHRANSEKFSTSKYLM